VRRPPQGHVLAEDAVPDVVKGESEQRVQAAARHQQSAHRRVPIAGDSHRGRARLVVRQHARQATGDEQQEQPEEDEVVRRVGQRPGVPAVADVQADVPDKAEQRRDDRCDEQGDGQRHPRRSLEPAARPFGEAVQPGDLAGPVQVADPQQGHSDDQPGDGHADDLAECCAATLIALCEQRKLHVHPHGTSCDSIELTRE
jgi:hypothetical protein